MGEAVPSTQSLIPTKPPGRTPGLQRVLIDTCSPPSPCQARHLVPPASLPLSASLNAPLSLQTAWHPTADVLRHLSPEGKGQGSFCCGTRGCAKADCPVLATARALLATGTDTRHWSCSCSVSGADPTRGWETRYPGTMGICLGPSPGTDNRAGCSARQTRCTVSR